MSTEAVDRRVRRTRKQLRECLVTLLKQKKVQDITVRELTEQVIRKGIGVLDTDPFADIENVRS